MLGAVVHAYNLNTGVPEAGELQSLQDQLG